MRPRINLRFRPSLILLIDETGAQIYEHLKLIARFTDFDPVLCQSVGLLQIDSQTEQATPLSLLGKDGFSDKRAPQETGPIEETIELVLRDVQNRGRINSIVEAGYPVPNTRTQIFIVGDAHSPELAKMYEIVDDRLKKIRFPTLVCYVVNAYHMRQISGPLGADPSYLEVDPAYPIQYTQAYWADRHVPNFCFLYEDLLAHPTPTFVRQEDSHYATAEALFALLATSLTTEPFFEDLMRKGPLFQGYENVGSLSTSLIAFPRRHALEYCAARLGIVLMGQWKRDLLNQNTPENTRRELQESARQAVRGIRQWIKDERERPLANNEHTVSPLAQEAIPEKLRWPHLLILKDAPRSVQNTSTRVLPENALPQLASHQQQRLHRTLWEETENLFLLFDTEDIESAYRRQRRRFANWTKLVLQRGNLAVDAYKDWEKAAVLAWEAAGRRINSEITARIDYLWSNDENGFEMATTYVDELDDHLSKLVTEQSRWREEHNEDYTLFLSVYERLAEGEWVVPPGNTTNGNRAAQAAPTMGNTGNPAPQNTQTNTTNPIIGNGNSGSPPPPNAFQHLPPREERLAQRLEQRVTWYQQRIPPVATQAVVAIPFLLSLVLTALIWLPATPLNLAIISAASTLIIGAANTYFQIHYRKKVKESKEELLNFYRRYYAHRSETREDRLRLLVTGPLRRTTQAIRERLDNLQDFIGETQNAFDEDTRRARRELFESPAGTRDIFVANGELLQQDRKNTLEDFAGQITKLRTKEPVEDWHRSSNDLKREMIRMFRQQSRSLMEMEEEETRQHIRTFATNVTRAYFKGPLVELQYALDKRNTWREALDRIENPLYQAQVGIRDPQFEFACGREQDIAKGTPYIPAHMYPVSISDTYEWVLLTAFYRGGLPTTINPEVLFPKKDALAAPAPSPSPGSSAQAPDDIHDALPSFDDDDDLPSFDDDEDDITRRPTGDLDEDTTTPKPIRKQSHRSR